MDTKILLYNPDDEIEDWYIAHGKRITHITQANHDEHGWSGMEMARGIINFFACCEGWKIEEVAEEPNAEDEA